MGQITAALWKEGEMEKDLKISANDKTSTDKWREREGERERERREGEGGERKNTAKERKWKKKKGGEEKIADKKCEKGTRTKQTIEGE